ncbi:hypothetical protein M8C21_031982, partial [Ambrosia artemisiifolia]
MLPNASCPPISEVRLLLREMSMCGCLYWSRVTDAVNPYCCSTQQIANFEELFLGQEEGNRRDLELNLLIQRNS